MEDQLLFLGIAWAGLLVGGGFFLGFWLLRRRRLSVMLIPFVGVAWAVAGYAFWVPNRPQPQPAAGETLFQGIDYIRDVRTEPRPLVIHVLKVDLEAPGLRFLVTPGDPEFDNDEDYDLRARTVSQFLDEFDLQVAINGDFFEPWFDLSFTRQYYPRAGDPVRIRGISISQGEVITTGYGRYPITLYITADNQVTMANPATPIPTDAFNAISGGTLIQENRAGALVTPEFSNPEPAPRTAIGLDREQRTLIIMVVDGRQPNFSEGVTIYELAALISEYGAYEAMNLDGGGSSALAIEAEDGRPQILNSPIHNRYPGLERPVANHLGIYANRE